MRGDVLRKLAHFAPTLALATGCTVLFPLDEREESPTTNSSASQAASTSDSIASSTATSSTSTSDGSGGGGGSAGGGGAGGEGGCEPQPTLDEDPNNCGACGRVCGEAVDGTNLDCIAGRCESSVVKDFGTELVFDLLGQRKGDALALHFTATTSVGHRFGVITIAPDEPEGRTVTGLAQGNAQRFGGLTFIEPEGPMASVNEPATGSDRLHFGDGAVASGEIGEMAVHHLAYGQVVGLEGLLRADFSTGTVEALTRTAVGQPFTPLGMLLSGVEYRGVWEIDLVDEVIYSTQLVDEDADGEGAGLRRIVIGAAVVDAIDVGPGSRIVALATDDSFVYWADCASGVLKRAPHETAVDPETHEVLWAEPGSHPIALRVDANLDGSVFLATTTDPARCGLFNTETEDQASDLVEISKGAPTQTRILASGTKIGAIACPNNEDYVYFTNRRPPGGSEVRRVHR